jgi:predicted 3-demethylubiquinone-9 3-methyltransferase (glyoxalase superfamily)
MSYITPCLWFDDDAEEAIAFYGTIFGGVEILESSRYPEGGPMPAGTLLAATFELAGQRIMVINGGPIHQLTEAFSFMVRAETQAEIDRLWERLTADGGEPGPCGWLKDRFGLSWQVVPPILGALLGDPDPEKAGRTMQAMLQMSKLHIAALQAAHDGTRTAG